MDCRFASKLLKRPYACDVYIDVGRSHYPERLFFLARFHVIAPRDHQPNRNASMPFFVQISNPLTKLYRKGKPMWRQDGPAIAPQGKADVAARWPSNRAARFFCLRLDDLAETPDLVFAVAVKVSPGLGLGLGGRIDVALVETGVAGAGAGFGRPGFGVLHVAGCTDAAVDGVGAGRDDGPVVVRVGVRGASDGREEWARRVAVPAGGFAHLRLVYPPCANGSDARVAVLVFARGAAHVPEVRAVAREGLLDGVLADEYVGKAGDVADVVTGPLADGIRFKDRSGVFHRVRLLADADLSDILP